MLIRRILPIIDIKRGCHVEIFDCILLIILPSISSDSKPLLDNSTPRWRIGLLDGLAFHGSFNRSEPNLITSVFDSLILAWDTLLNVVYTDTNFLTSLESFTNRTQSSAKANEVSVLCPRIDIPINFLLIVLRKGSKKKLYKIGDSGSPCLKPRVGIILLVKPLEERIL